MGNKDMEKSPLAPKVDDQQPHGSGRKHPSWLTVEPIAFLYNLGFVMSTSTNEQYASYYSALAMGGDPSLLSVGLCSLGANTTTWVAEVQGQAAGYLSVFSLLNNLPMLLVAVFMGSYSDRRGRKLIMALPVLGGLLRGAIALGVQTTFMDINYMWIGAGVEGVMGGSAVLTLALYAYIADVSSPARRVWRMVWLFVAESLGIAVAEVAVGYLITYSGFLYPYIAILAAYVVCLLLICVYLRESVHNIDESGHWSCGHLVRSFQPLFQRVGQDWPLVLWAATIALICAYAAQSVLAYALYLYVSQALCFTWVEVGYLIAVISVMHAIGSPAAVRLLTGRIRDSGIMALAALDGIIGQIYLIIPVMSVIYVYFQPVVALLAGTITPLARAIMSTSVGPDEQGAIQALAALCNVCGVMLGTVCATSVYSATSNSFLGAVFIFGAGIYFISMICALVMDVRIRRKGSNQLTKSDDPEK